MSCCEAYKWYDVCVCPSPACRKALDAVIAEARWNPNVPLAAAAVDNQHDPSLGFQGDAAPLPESVADRWLPYDSLYELTLTTTVDEPYELRTALERIVKSAMFEVKGYIACMELTKQGLPHIHALLFCKRKYIDGSKIKKLYKYRYECKRVRMPANYYEYLKKEQDNPEIQDYCDRKGIPQIWESTPQ